MRTCIIPGCLPFRQVFHDQWCSPQQKINRAKAKQSPLVQKKNTGAQGPKSRGLGWTGRETRSRDEHRCHSPDSAGTHRTKLGTAACEYHAWIKFLCFRTCLSGHFSVFFQMYSTPISALPSALHYPHKLLNPSRKSEGDWRKKLSFCFLDPPSPTSGVSLLGSQFPLATGCL